MWPLYIWYADDNLVSVYKNCNKASLSLYFLCRFARLSPYNPGRGGASHVRWLSGQQQHCWWDTSIIHHTNRIHCAAFSFLSYALFFISKAKFNYTPWSHKKMFYNAKENKCIKQTSPLMLITNHPLTLKNKQIVLLVRTVLLLKHHHIFCRWSIRSHPCVINPAQLGALHPKLKPDSSCPQGPHSEKKVPTLWAPKQTQFKSQAH